MRKCIKILNKNKFSIKKQKRDSMPPPPDIAPPIEGTGKGVRKIKAKDLSTQEIRKRLIIDKRKTHFIIQKEFYSKNHLYFK